MYVHVSPLVLAGINILAGFIDLTAQRATLFRRHVAIASGRRAPIRIGTSLVLSAPGLITLSPLILLTGIPRIPVLPRIGVCTRRFCQQQ